MRQFGSFWLGLRYDLIIKVWINARQLFKKDLITGLIVNIMNIDILDYSYAVNDKNSSLGGSIRTQNAISFGDCAMGPEIAQQWIMDSTQIFRPRSETWDVVDADTQDLGIISRELSQAGFV